MDTMIYPTCCCECCQLYDAGSLKTFVKRFRRCPACTNDFHEMLARFSKQKQTPDIPHHSRDVARLSPRTTLTRRLP